MKPTYEKADAEVVLFDNGDVITTSGVTTGSGSTENTGCENWGPHFLDNWCTNPGNHNQADTGGWF